MRLRTLAEALLAVLLMVAGPFIFIFGPEGVVMLFSPESHGLIADVRVGPNWNAVISLIAMLLGLLCHAGACAEEPALKVLSRVLIAIGWLAIGVFVYRVYSPPFFW